LSNFRFLVCGCTADELSVLWLTAAPFTAELLLEVDDLLDKGFIDLTQISSKHIIQSSDWLLFHQPSIKQVINQSINQSVNQSIRNLELPKWRSHCKDH